MKQFIGKKGFLIILFAVILTNILKSQDNFVWGKQLGTDAEEYTLNHVTDQIGNIYISGKTTGAMDGKNFGKNDGFITKIDSSGNTIWTKQFGTAEEEDVQWSAIDEKSCVYITGSTTGGLNGKNLGREDLFVIKYDPEGKMLWSRQFGTDSTDIGTGIYSDKTGSIYITGQTKGKIGQTTIGKTDGFVIKLDNEGNKLYINQFGTVSDDYPTAVTGDKKSGIYVCGSTWGDLGAKNKGFLDAFVGKFNDNGNMIKFNQFGSEGFDMALQIVIGDELDIYIGGSSSGNLGGDQAGEGDCFLTKINSKGDIIWLNQFGTKNHDGIRGIDFNENISDCILVSGILNLPPARAFIRMYRKDGSLLWERNFIAQGMNGDTSGKNVSLDNKGNFYHLGLTGGNLFGTLIGGHDVYIVKYTLNKSYMNNLNN